MSTQKVAFTSRDIEAAFGMSNREQVYLVDRGHLVPDVQYDRPRLYSLYSAMKAGAVQFFMRQGYKLERADRLAEIVVLTAAMSSQDNNSVLYSSDVRILMDIKDGDSGVVYLDFGNLKRHNLLFVSAHEGNLEPERTFDGDNFISVCVYNMKGLWNMLSSGLGADWRAISAFPEYVERKVEFVVLNKVTGTKRLMFKADRIK
jgi:hypothetical protein